MKFGKNGFNMKSNFKDNNIVIKSRFLTAKNKDYSWMTSTDISSSETQWGSGGDYRSRKTECTIQRQIPENGKTGKTYSYFDYASRDFKVTSEGFMTKQGIYKERRMFKDWQKKFPIAHKSIVWDQVISFKQEYFEKHQIFEMKDANRILKKTFDQFVKDNKMDPNAIQYFANWHVDKPHHFHMHIRIHQTKESIRDYKTGKMKIRTRGRFTNSSFRNWKDRIDLELNKERKLFKDLGLERDKVKYKVLGGFEDSKTINKIINDARLIKSMLPKGRMQYNSIKDPVVKTLVDNLTNKLISSNSETKDSFERLNKLIDKKKYDAISDTSFEQTDRTIQSINALAKEKKKEMFAHLANQALKRIKSISDIDPKENKNNLKASAIKNSINRNNNFIRGFHKKGNIEKAFQAVDAGMNQELQQINLLARKNRLEAERGE